MLLLITGTVILAILLWRLMSHAKKNHHFNKIQSPPGELPILGHVLQLASAKHPEALLKKWGWEYGPVARININGTDMVLITDPDLIVMLHRKTETLLKPSRQMVASLTSVGIGKSIATIDLPHRERKILRRLVERPLSPIQVAGMRETIVSLGLQVRDIFLEGIAAARITEQKDQMAFQKNQMDFLRILKKAAFDSMLMIAYGMNPKDYVDTIRFEDVNRIANKMVERAFVPFPYWDYFKTTSDLEAEQSVTRITQGARSFLQKALSISDQASTMMLQGFMENHRSTTDNLGSDILVENFIGFLVASQDTTATTTFRIMHFLAKHPRVQQQVQREVDGILNGLARIEDLATLDPNEAFKYIHAVVRETNRLDPVSSLTTHSAAQDIQLDGVVIPKGTELLLHNNVSMLKFSNFEDPFEFRPERWFELDSNEHLRKKELQSFMPFSAGPHICPGRHLAMAEILFFTAIMCSEFEISYRPGPSFVNDLATNQFNLPLQIRKRSPSSE